MSRDRPATRSTRPAARVRRRPRGGAGLRGGLPGVAALVVLAATAGACARDDAAPAGGADGAAAATALPAVALPDLSALAEPVRRQVRERHAAVADSAGAGAAPEVAGRAHGELGLMLMAAGFHAAAETSYLNARALAPEDSRWPYYLGHLYKTLGEPARAAEAFERVVERRPTDLAALVWLGEMYLLAGRPEAAERVFAHAAGLAPESSAALSGMGRAALARGDYARSAEHLERALAIEPQALSLHSTAALAHQRLGALDRAAAHLDRRGVGKPTLPDPWMQAYDDLLRSPTAFRIRGARALEGGRPAAAIEAFRRGLELAPDDPELLSGLGEALARTGDRDGAMAQFEAALREVPGHPRALFGVGTIRNLEGRPDRAVAPLSAAVEGRPGYLEARLALAESLRVTGRLRESLPHLERIVALAPGLTEPWIVQAMTLVRLERYREARDHLTRARQVHPELPVLTDLLVRVLAAAPDGAVRDGRRALALMETLLDGPGNFSMSEAMAMTLAELGRFDEAVTWQRRAMAEARAAGGRGLAEGMAANLALYEQRRPCRTPLG